MIIRKDISYAEISEAQKLDLYLPEQSDESLPLIVFIHGGAFMMCDKADHQVNPYLTLVGRGYAVASLNYRLSGEAIFPAGLHDIKAAVRFLRANAIEYNLDPVRFIAAGGSAGGYYSAMLCLLTGRNEFENLSLGNAGVSSDVQCGVIWYPPTDFLRMDEHLKESDLHPQDHNDPDSPESRLMGGHLVSLDKAYMQSSNPLEYVHDQMPPMLIQHGRIDHIVPYQQSVILTERIKDVGGNVILEIFETADHADKQFETPENMARVERFIKNSMKCGT